MKNLLSLFAALGLILSCQSEKNPDGTGDNDGNKEVLATAIKLSTNELTLEKGANYVLKVKYTPSNTTMKDITWVSSNTSIATVEDGIVVGVASGSTEIIAKCGDVTDKCKVTVVVSATGIKINKTSLELYLNDTETLVATIEPAESTDKVTWMTSDETVATVTDGLIMAIGSGEATIIATAGSQKAECKVTVSLHVPEAIDLGLSVKWASFNLGASKPGEYGYYYAWGETEPKENYSWSKYKFGNSASGPFSKYNTNSTYGTVDYNTVLDTEDDVAHVKLGGKWRMPTRAEWYDLIKQCTWTYDKENEVKGVKVTATNGNSIFLPAAGWWHSSVLEHPNGDGFYWSSSLFSDRPAYAFHIYFFYNLSTGIAWGPTDYYRCYGLSVRPVCE